MRLTFYGLLSLGLLLLAVYLGGGLLLSAVTSPAQDDWLVDGRYVVLNAKRYRPGSVTHFDFRRMQPSRNAGFFLLAGDGDYAAIFDRSDCQLAHRPAEGDLYNACAQRSYPVERILAGGNGPDELLRLPVRRRGDELVIDVVEILSGAGWR